MIEIKLPFVHSLALSLKDKDPLIQVVLGPRQVGKTTGVKQILADLDEDAFFYISADGYISKPASWIHEQWVIAKTKNKNCLLVIDEIQKVENWSEIIKKLWDEQSSQDSKIKLILLGSSSLSIQKGLSESLAGRYQVNKVYHWNYEESYKAYGLTFDEFLIHGGYPGSYRFISDEVQWLKYIKESIIEAVIGKDILTTIHVKSPALFKQLFDIACSYSAQEVSYTKLLGQLQDKGNTDLIKYYLEHLEGAFLIKQIFKYSTKPLKVRSSSPKILPLCPSLFSCQLDADLNTEERGRCFELIVGAALTRLPGSLYYWRVKDSEVDYIYKFKKKLFAIEVKSGRKKSAKGLNEFMKSYPSAEGLIVTPDSLSEVLELCSV